MFLINWFTFLQYNIPAVLIEWPAHLWDSLQNKRRIHALKQNTTTYFKQHSCTNELPTVGKGAQL
jgi:hypothetical protein